MSDHFPHVREPSSGEPDICIYCREEWVDLLTLYERDECSFRLRAEVERLRADLDALARFVVVEIEDDWRTRHAEVRLVDVVAGGWHTRAAFVDMPLGEAVALALLSLEDAPTSG